MKALTTVLFLFALSTIGCLSDQSPVVGGTPANRCNRNSDCPDGTCDLSQHRCVSVTSVEVFFSATPPSGVGSARGVATVTRPREVHSGDRIDLALSAPRTVYGLVTVPSSDMNSSGRAISATLEFSPSGTGGITAPVRALSSSDSFQTINDMPAAWSARLTEGLYDVVVRPAAELSAVVPPRFEQGFEVRHQGIFQRFIVAYPADYTRWEGTVVDRAGRPLTGFTVRAVDPARDNTPVSTVTHTALPTDNSPVGSFAIDLAPGAPDAWVLRFTSDTSSQGWLTVDLPHSALSRMSPSGRGLRIELPSDTGLPYLEGLRPSGLPAPTGPLTACVGCVDVRGSVERAGTSSPRSLVNAMVSLRSDITLSSTDLGVTAWFEARTQTGTDGMFTASLIPGTYNVVISPMDAQTAVTVVRNFRVRDDVTAQSGQVFTASPRISLDGRALTPQGEAVRAARVTAVPFSHAYVNHPCLADPVLQLAGPRANRADTVTQSDGSYHLDLDPGLYRLLIEPTDHSGYPTTLSVPVCVTARVSNFDTTLDAPAEIRGTLRDALGAPAPGADLEGIIRVREPGALGVVIPIARTTTDSNGAYTLLLPSTAAR